MRLIFVILTAATVQLSSAMKYTLVCRSDVLNLSLKICIEQVGTVESGENRGKQIEIYLAAVGLPAGYAYCAAGQYWCFAEACRRLTLAPNYIPLKRTALANAMFNYAARKGKPARYSVQVDDLIVWQRGKSQFGHIERVIRTGKAGWVYTIGFNTVKIIGKKRCEGVFVHKRNIFHLLGRLRIRGIIGFNERSGK